MLIKILILITEGQRTTLRYHFPQTHNINIEPKWSNGKRSETILFYIFFANFF